MARRFLIQFAGTIGAGKTTLIRQLAPFTPNSVVIDEDKEFPVNNIRRFYEGNYNALEVQRICYNIHVSCHHDIREAFEGGAAVVYHDRCMLDVYGFARVYAQAAADEGQVEMAAGLTRVSLEALEAARLFYAKLAAEGRVQVLFVVMDGPPARLAHNIFKRGALNPVTRAAEADALDANDYVNKTMRRIYRNMRISVGGGATGLVRLDFTPGPNPSYLTEFVRKVAEATDVHPYAKLLRYLTGDGLSEREEREEQELERIKLTSLVQQRQQPPPPPPPPKDEPKDEPSRVVVAIDVD